jgi:Zn-dependent M28 family amino/carboxypeptidase
MTRKMTWVRSTRLLTLVLAIQLAALVTFAQSISISTEEDLKAALLKTPCKDDDRQAAVGELFRSMGAEQGSIVVQERVGNVIVVKPGKTKEMVIVGAHFDKTPDGCGVIDNWSGIVILANLYKTIKPLATQKTFMFVGFAKEEKGLVGSGAMADGIPKEERSAICAMVNFDSFGLAYPQAMTNISDGSLVDLAESVAKEMKMPFRQAAIENASSDSASFRSKKIPSISLHGLDGRWRDYLHSNSDKFVNVNMQSVYAGYRHGLVMLSKIENMPCESFRK